jgi:sulfite oxidase
MELSMGELRARWPAVTLEAALICAGNRRAELSAVRPTRGALQWQGDAVGNTTWTGVRLADVLEAAGIVDGAAHVAFEGADPTPDLAGEVRFGASIPLDAALRGGAVLAFEMGGRPLLPEHGSPVRALVPGYIGARSVKWLSRVTIRREPSDNPFQARDYRLFPPDVLDPDAADGAGTPLGETPLDASITAPLDGQRLPAGEVEVRGYALAGGESSVQRVEVSADGGSTWEPAALLAPASDDAVDRRWAWRRWRCVLALRPGVHELVVRAWDSAGATQPADPASVWNVSGYANNAWHRVRIAVHGPGEPRPG